MNRWVRHGVIVGVLLAALAPMVSAKPDLRGLGDLGGLQPDTPQVVTAPTQVSYQGRVTVNGNPHNGTGYFKFAIVNQAGTTSYWSNDGTSVNGSEPTANVPLNVSNGIFLALLGNRSLSGMTQPLTSAVFAAPDRYLRVWFATAPGGPYSQLTPDHDIGSSPFALNAETLDGQDSSAFAAASHTHLGQTWSGNAITAGLTLNNSGQTGIRASGSAYGLWGYATASVGGYGVYGTGSWTGVHGLGNYGVVGQGTTTGVYGASNDYGLYGSVNNTSGPNYAVYGTASNASAVDYGVYGTSDNTGVYGNGTAYGVFGAGNIGVRGDSANTGLYGYGQNGAGVYAVSMNSLGVYGQGAITGIYGTSNDIGVYGEGSATGVYGEGSSRGLYGRSDGVGVYGEVVSTASTNFAVYGFSYNTGVADYGVYGLSDDTGLYGSGFNGYGVYGTSSETGVYGSAIGTAAVTHYGLYGSASGSSSMNIGVYATATGDELTNPIYGLYATSDFVGVYAEGGPGDYGIITPNAIYVGQGCTGCLLGFTARNGGDAALEAGDLVAVIGGEAPLLPGSQPVMVVRKAVTGDAIIGVVHRAARLETVSRPDPKGDGEVSEPMLSYAEGVAALGDLLVIVTHGPTYVKVSGAVAVGDLLIAGAEPGTAQATRRVMVEGVTVSPADVLGKVLGPADPATGLAPVLVTLQ